MTQSADPLRRTPLSSVLGLLVFLTLSLTLSGCSSTSAPIIINKGHTINNADLALQDLVARRDARGREIDVVIKGTAVNTTQKTIQTHALKVTLQDQRGREQAALTARIPKPKLAAGEKTPFLFSFTNPPAPVHAAQIDFIEIGAGLRVKNVSIRKSGTNVRQGITVTGNIVNTTATYVEMPPLLVGITNRAGDMIREQIVLSNLPLLSPGVVVPFTVVFKEQAQVLYPLSLTFISKDELRHLIQMRRVHVELRGGANLPTSPAGGPGR